MFYFKLYKGGSYTIHLEWLIGLFVCKKKKVPTKLSTKNKEGKVFTFRLIPLSLTTGAYLLIETL